MRPRDLAGLWLCRQERSRSRKAICEEVFAATLDGHPLVSNRSVWRNFPWIWNEHWSFGNMVLIGDALHTAHFSIGSGTRLAIEDAIALAKALEAETDIRAALARYQAERKPIVQKLVTAARTSADWYEQFPRAHAARADGLRLQLHHPLRPHRRCPAAGDVAAFMARYEAAQTRRRASDEPRRSADQVPRRQPGRPRDRLCDSATATMPAASCSTTSREGRGDRPALIGPAGTRSYAELCAEACRWGNGFASLGLKRGDRVLLFLDDTPAYPAAFFGAVRAGFVPLLINTLTPPDLLQFYLADSGAAVAVADAEFADALRCGGLQGHRAAHADRRQWRGCATTPRRRRSRRRAGSRQFPAELARSRHPSQRDGVLDVLVGLDRTAQGHRASAARHGLQRRGLCAQSAEARRPTTSASRCRRSSSPTASAIPSPSRSRPVRRRLLLPGQPKPASIFEAIERFRPTVFFGLPTLYTALTKADGADSDRLLVAAHGGFRRRGAVGRGLQRLEGAHRPRDRRGARLDRGAAHLSLQPPRDRRSSAPRACACPATRSR